MAAAQGVVHYQQQERTLTFRVEGRGTMTHALPLRRHAERCMEQGTDRVRIDLRDCSYMDSTFLGTILTLKKALDRTAGQLTLITPSSACVRILQGMGLGDVLPAETAEPDAEAKWTELECQSGDSGMFRANLTQAHQELSQLPGPAGEQFKAAMRCLADAEKKERS